MAERQNENGVAGVHGILVVDAVPRDGCDDGDGDAQREHELHRHSWGVRHGAEGTITASRRGAGGWREWKPNEGLGAKTKSATKKIAPSNVKQIDVVWAVISFAVAAFRRVMTQQNTKPKATVAPSLSAGMRALVGALALLLWARSALW